MSRPQAQAAPERAGAPRAALLLAAGRGERMRPLTDTTPKPLLRAGGTMLIAYHLAALAERGIRDIVVNLSYLGERIREALGSGSPWGVRIRYSEEGPVPLETGGGIYNALSLLPSGPFLVINSDIFTDFDPGTLRLDADADARIVLAGNPPHHPRGDFALDGERVVSRESDRLTFTGIGIYRAALFDGCSPGRFPLKPLLERAIAAGRLRGQLHRGEWLDIGSPQRLAELDARLSAAQQRDAPQPGTRRPAAH